MVSGIINKMWTKNVEIKRGARAGKTAQVHLFSLSGDNDTVYSLAFGTPDVKVGDEVSFSCEEKFGEMQVDKSTVKIQSRDNKFEEPKEAPKPAAPSGGSSGGGKSYSRGNFPLDFTDGQRSILRQHAFTQASEVYRWRGDQDEERDGDSPDAIVGEIIKLAYKIERYTSGDDLREDM